MDVMQKCFVCNIAMVKKDSFVNIFEERNYGDGNVMTALAPALAKILNIEIKPNIDDLRSPTICPSCVRDSETYLHFETSLDMLRVQMVSRYRNTLATLNEQRCMQKKGDIYNVNMDFLEEEEFNSDCDTMSHEEESDNETNKNVADSSQLIINVDEIRESDIDEIQQQLSYSDSFYMNEDSDSCEDLLDSENLTEFVDENAYDVDDPFICQHCKPVTLHHDISAYNQHLCDKHNVPVHNCIVCGDTYVSLLELHNHMDAAHTGVIEIICEVCKEAFGSFDELREHLKEHAMDFVCLICNKGCRTKKHLDYHMAAAHKSDGEEFQFKCGTCDKVLRSLNALKAHERSHNTRRKSNFPCTKCDKCFRKETTLQKHMSMHSDRKQFVCKLCEKVFNAKVCLAMHMAEHKDIKPYNCSICDKTFSRRHDVIVHQRVHTGERPFKCDVCNATFTQRSNLNSHKKVIHLNTKSFECTICKKSFKRRRVLDFHIKSSHTGERPYSCKLCSATFIYPDYYKRHLLIHKGVKPFSCEVCGKHFSCRENRNVHLFVHSNKKPYECVDCGEGFMRKPQLMAHKKASKHLSETIIINEPQLSNETRRLIDGQTEEPSTADNDNSSAHICDTKDFPLEHNEHKSKGAKKTIISSKK